MASRRADLVRGGAAWLARCYTHGDDIEVIGEPLGEAGELAFGIIGESVEAICEVSMAVSSPIVGGLANCIMTPEVLCTAELTRSNMLWLVT